MSQRKTVRILFVIEPRFLTFDTVPGIVIVDLDDSDIEDTTDDTPQVSVNLALLDHLKRHQHEPNLLADLMGPSTSDANKALVLFKPLSIPGERDLPLHPQSVSTMAASQSGNVSLGLGIQADKPAGDFELNPTDVDPSRMDVDDAMEVE